MSLQDTSRFPDAESRGVSPCLRPPAHQFCLSAKCLLHLPASTKGEQQ